MYSEKEILPISLHESDPVTAVKQHVQLREAAGDVIQSDPNLSFTNPGLVLPTPVNLSLLLFEILLTRI